MQQVMVHIDESLGPIGAWGFDNGGLTHFYPESLDVEIPARARDAMAARQDNISVPEWFALLATHPNALDQYATFEVHDGVSLPAVVADFRREWYRQVQQ